MYWLAPTALFDGNILDTQQALLIEDNHISKIVDKAGVPETEEITPYEGIVSIGFFDVQVNGGGGIMLNNEPTPEGVAKIATAHRKCGTSFILPTVITDEHEILEKAAQAVTHELGKNGVLGIHIEGPHIALKRKGTHKPDFIRPFDDKTMGVIKTLRKNEVPVLLTLAPECVEVGLIEELNKMGVRVSAGHTEATAEQIQSAIDEGLSCFTHLFNAMPPMLGREPGVVATAINSDLWCSIITDGHHVDDQMVALTIRARAEKNSMIVVSDAMSTIGGPDHFELYGETIRVENGKLVNQNGNLAGAHIDMQSSVKRLIHDIGIDIVEALHMATLNPREMMGLPRQQLLGSSIDELAFL
jgi:N-acetylglucosamine-6-phosphate deacetylase